VMNSKVRDTSLLRKARLLVQNSFQTSYLLNDGMGRRVVIVVIMNDSCHRNDVQYIGRYSITTQQYDLGRYQLQESVSPSLQPVHSILNKDLN
jgi:hypothetical protein